VEAVGGGLRGGGMGDAGGQLIGMTGGTGKNCQRYCVGLVPHIYQTTLLQADLTGWVGVGSTTGRDHQLLSNFQEWYAHLDE
jgi:hypothetical protein